MKVKVKVPFYDAAGIHKKGEIIDVDDFSSDLMELVDSKAEKKMKIETAVSKTEKKTAIRKKVIGNED